MNEAQFVRDYSIHLTRFPSDRTSVPRKVRAPNGLGVGQAIEVDTGSSSTAVIFGQKVEPLPRWYACEVIPKPAEMDSEAGGVIYVKLKG